MTHEVSVMGYRLVRYLYRNVAVRTDTIVKLLDQLDVNEDGRVSLGEIAAALKALWKTAMGKTERKTKKMRTVD